MPFKGVRERFFGSSGWNLGKFEATIILYRDFHLLLSYLSGQNVISLSLSLEMEQMLFQEGKKEAEFLDRVWRSRNWCRILPETGRNNGREIIPTVLP